MLNIKNKISKHLSKFIILSIFISTLSFTQGFAASTSIDSEVIDAVNGATAQVDPVKTAASTGNSVSTQTSSNNLPANPNPSGGSSNTELPAITPDEITQSIGIFKAKCIFPHAASADAEEMGGTATACDVKDSIVGVLMLYLQNIIPYLAILVMLWAGFLYYGSATSGSNKQAINAIRGAAGGLVLLLISNIILGFFTTSDTKKGKTGLDILFGNDAGDKGSVLGFVTSSIILPAFTMLQFVAGAFAVFSLVYAGYLYILSNTSGDSSLVKRAQTALKNAIIGFLLVMLAVSIIAFIQTFVNQVVPGK